jgi:hypothetical protein
MPSVSKAQQAVMGQAWGLRKGLLRLKDINPKYRDEIKSIANGDMTDKELKKFASTKSTPLPHYVEDGKGYAEKPKNESEEMLDEKGIAVPGATSPLIASKGMPTFTTGINPGGGIKPITPYLNPEVQKPKGKKKLSNLADYRDYINQKKK